jgi:hypothetical protein
MARRAVVLLAMAAFALAACSGGGSAGGSTAYPRHEDVTATVFWVGEPASTDNDEIANAASYWDADWEAHFGGFDDPDHRTPDGSRPAAFTPTENPFYAALPYGELDDDDAVKPDVDRIPWYQGQRISRDRSLLKNRWIEVSRDRTTVYAQWQDVGPFQEDDPDYVFGSAAPTESRSGLDLSPAAAAALGLDGRGRVSWRFVRATDVPDGPWTRIETTRGGIPEG